VKIRAGQTPITGQGGETFKFVPTVTINTTTGEGAALYPVLQFVPQFIVDNPDLNAQNIGISSYRKCSRLCVKHGRTTKRVLR
jgi:hypothetical protein